MPVNTNLKWRYVIVLLFIAVLAYLPGLPGGFIYDDYFNILQNPTINNSDFNLSSAWSATQSGVSGPLGRPLAMLSFYLNYQLSGFSPSSFKIFNIAIHAINGALIFIVVGRLLNVMLIRKGLIVDKLKIEHLAFWIALLWVVHPINLTVVLYVVQRMTSMAATFTLLGIYYYINLRDTKIKSIRETAVSLAIILLLGLMAALCKENGALLFLYLFVIECFVYQWREITKHTRWSLYVFYACVIVLPSVIAGILVLNGVLIANYSGRDFGLSERVLTEFRVLWFYIFQILSPQAHLFGLYHDDFIVSKSLLQPISTLWSILTFVLVAVFAVKYARKIPWIAFGVAFFIAGHLLESTIFPLNLVHEHRNYVPSIGLIFIFVMSLDFVISKVTFLRNYVVFFIVAILFSSITISRAYDWSDMLLLGERLAQGHPESTTANYEMGYIYARRFEETGDPSFGYTAQKALKKADLLSSNNLQPALALAHISALLGEAEDQQLMNKIVAGFRDGKVTNTEVIELRQFVQCQIQDNCNTKATTIKSIFDALTTNPALRRRLKDDALFIYSSYLVTIPGGAEQALTIMKDVASRNKNTLEYQVQLISVLLTNERHDEATVLMEKLTDQYGIKWELIKK